ncbi:hypothetical protein A2661_02305 [Candidatus Giovannonibacteria bacterium RIFCSPHIGHO2_01_FULL_45_24]|uniref:DUF4258 domain-containing protein n=1 Tax=Candidatus Giovannonibacteria bacterium RIFCSPLOWO2_01_FULL_46_32 TaxID=1798353 RepID=A0A1F5XI31_9BACT|nr:MAG: hypothetical protein A2661_02305 [Candidatus Giovannonibacteria bacterium RIFCSPHIGHO2_01_FULL_45_24]OGF87529.1 MAG: hypothetical protein A3B19_03030 [Candidatus Giovannonibacteria bacterium RIFCSPLOWO2_01_FULL_46_32]
MDYELTRHAKERMAERRISEKLLESAILHPNKVLYDEKDKIMFKKLYAGDKRLLIVVAERVKNRLKIITIIDTSQVKKYL